MPNFDSVPGAGGIAGIIGLFILACFVVTFVTGETVQWLLVPLGIAVGLVAVRSINGR
jgi:hypothetical protein